MSVSSKLTCADEMYPTAHAAEKSNVVAAASIGSAYI